MSKLSQCNQTLTAILVSKRCTFFAIGKRTNTLAAVREGFSNFSRTENAYFDLLTWHMRSCCATLCCISMSCRSALKVAVAFSSQNSSWAARSRQTWSMLWGSGLPGNCCSSPGPACESRNKGSKQLVCQQGVCHWALNTCRATLLCSCCSQSLHFLT